MTWEIALGIFALVSFAAVVIGWSSKISGTLSKLNESVDNLNKTVEKFQTSSDKIHGELFDRINELDRESARHNEQIKNLINEVKKL